VGIFEHATLENCGRISVILTIKCAFERVSRFKPQILAWRLRISYNILGEEALADSGLNHIALLVIQHDTSLEIFYRRNI